MELDVSPDGETIVFEALGDLYTVPVEGGEAELLVGGAAWDTHPRYSPDGKTVAFVSDREGTSGLWIAHVQSDQVSRISMPEPGRLGPPSWSESGLSLYAGRTTSSGGSDIWVFSVAGTAAERLPLPRSVAHPTLDWSGRYLYYIGNRAQVMRAEVDGANPTPITDSTESCGDRLALAKDGDAIAYTCVEGKAVRVYLQDLATGRRAPVHHMKTPYLGRTALHTRAFAFVGSSHDLVVADYGGLHFVETARDPEGHAYGKRRIPFSFNVSVANPRRPVVQRRPGPVSPLPLWPRVSPDGRYVVAAVAGKLWVWDQTTGIHRRLTKGDRDAIESSPSISRDGCCIVFSVWDGVSGSIRTIDIDGAQERVVAQAATPFLHPTWSPDQSRIAAVRVPHSTRRFNLSIPFSVVEADLGTGTLRDVYSATHSRRHARQFSGHPRYDEDGNRIAVVVHKGQESRLVVANRDGTGVGETVLRTTPAEELAWSPGGLSVALAANGGVYIVEINNGSSARVDLRSYPKFLERPGYFLSWLGDDKLVSCRSASCETRSLSTDSKHTLRLQTTAAAPSDGSLVLRGGRVVTMGATGSIDSAAVVVVGGRLAYVGPRRSAAIPAGATVIDVSESVIIPGLIDTHAHIGHLPPELVHMYSWITKAYLRFGVTTIYDPQPPEVTIAALADLVQTSLHGPTILSSGAPIFGEDYQHVFPDMVATIHHSKDAANAVARAAQFSTGPLKVYAQPNRQHRLWLAESAAHRGLRITGEGACDRALALTMVVDGYSGFEHAIPGPIYGDVRELLRRSGVSYTPTLTVACGSVGALGWFANSLGVPERAWLASVMPQDEFARRMSPISDTLDTAFWVAARNAAGLAEDGVAVTVGGHGEMPGVGTIWETIALQMGGLSPPEALRAATVNGARKLGIESDVGSLDVGKRANLVVLKDDPTIDVWNLLSVVGVVQDGQWFSAADQSGPFATVQREPRPMGDWNSAADHGMTDAGDSRFGGINKNN